MDAAYSEGVNSRDLNAWAIAHQLLGFERLYVPGQFYYRRLHDAQVERGLMMYGHDLPHRYVDRTARKPPYRPTEWSVQNAALSSVTSLCLHERWYDQWVFLSGSVDEYFTFFKCNSCNTSKLPDVPKHPMPLVQTVIGRYLAMRTHPSKKPSELPLDRLGRPKPCVAMGCVPHRIYGDPERINEAWTPAWITNSSSHGASSNRTDRLQIERHSMRFPNKPLQGSIRKCFVHPDWRAMAPQTKIHGFPPDGCPWLFPLRPQCIAASEPSIRLLCTELCGIWGRQRSTSFPPVRSFTQSSNDTCPNQGTRETDLFDMEMRDGKYELERAHLRGAPRTVAAGGTKTPRMGLWLQKLSHSVRLGLETMEHGRHAAA